MKLNFGQEALVLPGAVLSQGTEAEASYWRVLLWLASDLSLGEKPKQLAKLADCDGETVRSALLYWKERGILTEDGESVAVMAAVSQPQAAPRTAKKKTLLHRADELPSYTSVEIADLLEQRAGVRMLVDEAQQILGKMFNPGEINILIGMLDYLGMGEESILMLLAYCKRVGKTNLRSIEKSAYGLVDKGITEPEALEEELRILEAMHTFEGEVRAMFGMKNRALTTKESKLLRAWMGFGYGIDIVRLAYERTVAATNEPSVPYANAILERWNAEGLRTLGEIQEYLAEQEAKKNGAGKPELGNSFDTDDFFEAALRRSYQES